MSLKSILKSTFLLFCIVNASFLPLSSLSQAKEVNLQTDNESVAIKEWSEFFDDSLGDLTEEVDIAKEENKKAILLMFEMEECPFCARMKRNVLNRSDVQDYFHKHFRILSMDVEGDLELTDFKGKTTTQKDFSLKQNRVRATPVFQFFDLKGKPLKNGRLTGATKDATEFLLLGKYIVEDHNEKMSFFKFKRSHKSKQANKGSASH